VRSTLFYYFLIGMQCLVSTLLAQENACENDVRKIYRQRESVSLDQGYYIKYGVQTIYKDKSFSSQEVLFTMMYKDYQLHVLSDVLNTYADTNTVVSLSRLTKKIIVGSNTKTQFSNMLNNTSQMSDSLLWKNFGVSSCKAVAGHKEYNQELVLQAKKTNAEVRQIVYLYHQQSAALYKVTNKYSKSAQLEELNYTFYKIDYQYSGSDIKSKNINSFFFDSKGKLLPAYAGYELIDQRNKK
jgi:hypothetical protein